MTAPSRVLAGTFVRERRARVAFRDRPPAALPAPVRRPARVAHTLALAHHVRTAIAEGQFADQAAVARALGLTRARVTQLLDLLLLAPDVQAAVVALEAVDGVEPVTERRLRAVTRHARWDRQRAEWHRFVATGGLCGRRRSRNATKEAEPVATPASA